MTHRLLAVIALGCLLTPACSAGSDERPPRAAESSPTASASLLPSLAGPKAQTHFDVIRENGVRPGSADDFLIRDLIVVGEAQRAYLAVHGEVVSLEELKKAAGYRVGGSKLELVSGLGSSSRFCLRSYQSDDSPRQWFYDTNRVLSRGEYC